MLGLGAGQTQRRNFSGHHRETESSFGRHGAPDTLLSDNATPYVSAPLKAFTRNWGFTHETISPSNSQANGSAEAAVESAKRILRKRQSSGEDPYIALRILAQPRDCLEGEQNQ